MSVSNKTARLPMMKLIVTSDEVSKLAPELLHLQLREKPSGGDRLDTRYIVLIAEFLTPGVTLISGVSYHKILLYYIIG